MERDPLVESRAAPSSGCCCCCCCSEPRHINDAFVDKYLSGDIQWGYTNMAPRDESKLEELRKRMTDRKRFPTTVFIKTESQMEMGFQSAKEMMDIMYQGTNVPGVEVPDALRGIFWMKGNGVGEELVTLQWGRWIEEEKMLLVPYATYMWGWPWGTPTNAPFRGFMYGNDSTVTGARVLLGSGKPPPDSNPPGSLSFKFDSDLKYGTLQGHREDMREDIVDLSTFLGIPFCSCIRGHFTMELLESDSSEPGSRWKRGIWWGCGSCTPIEFGSYTLTKVLKSNGEPNEPYYSEFLKYMGDVPLFTWSGFI